MIVYDKEQKEIVIPNGIGNINLFNNGVEAGYNQGKIDGIDEQKGKLESINITENGTYDKEDGYNHIEVNVPDLNGSYDEGYEQGHTEGYNEGYTEGEGVGYNQGKTDGINEQKGKLSQITISENGTYAKEDGYNKVIVNVPDLNGDYNEGYEQGKTDGVNEQKSKLESISITENGTYDREDGYNHIEVNVPDLNGSYNEGYKQGQADLVAEARVLNVTENGVYKSKYSDPIFPDTYTVTGVYADGTKFYNYAELSSKVFNTKIAGSLDSRLEFWYKGDSASAGFGNNIIIGAGNNNDYGCFQVNYYIGYNSWVRISIGTSSLDINDWDDTVWHHLIISKAEGLWVDGEKKGDFIAYNTINGNFFINGIGYDTARNANGTFGMIKIDDIVIIPTADGFLNTNTGELLEVVKDGSYNFTENLPTYPEGGGELYKTVNVNIDVDSYYNNGYNQGKTDGVNEQKGKLSQITISENGTYTKEDGYSEVVVNVPDLNGSYNEGYEQGKTDGVNEQKGKLESINITENGTYRKEDGYNEVVVNVPELNGSYDEGYNQGKEDAAANARVLEVTENGKYLSKFSDPIVPTLVTGVYADGTDFYNYAELNGKVFNTKIAATVDSRLEFWYKGNNTINSNGWNLIIGAGNSDDTSSFQVRYFAFNNDKLCIEGGSRVIINGWDDIIWHHLIISKTEGIWIDGEKKGDFSTSSIIEGEFFINGIGYDVNGDGLRNANGTFGMIKIDDTIIIPTADGFQNVNTGELLEVVKDGSYTFTENRPIYGEGELYKTINVNVVPKINVQKERLKFGQSIFTEIPEWADFEGVTDMSYMFEQCMQLQTIPQLDTSKVTNMSSMFNNCQNLQRIPQLDTSKVTDMSFMFASCINLTSLPALNAQNLNMPTYYGIFGYSELSKLTDFGGFLNLKCSLTNNTNFIKLPNLTYESCINVLNGLYDFTGNGETPNSNQGQLKVHQNFLDKVGDEISIGTLKGWSITA